MMTDYVDRFDLAYLPKLGFRAPTFRAVIREAVSRKVKSIVETGSMRKEGNWDGDGQSTIIWADYIKWHTGSFVTIDIDQDAIDLVRKLVPENGSIVSDSVVELVKPGPVIDLLYLDSFDLDMTNVGPAAMHCMFEFCAARPRLRSGSIVFIDDTPVGADYVINGKGAYVAEWFKKIDVAPFTWGYQVAWIMP
jgi:predicted O-methyltransferase YrrM